jgi:flagellar biogenesis protein FliO
MSHRLFVTAVVAAALAGPVAVEAQDPGSPASVTLPSAVANDPLSLSVKPPPPALAERPTEIPGDAGSSGVDASGEARPLGAPPETASILPAEPAASGSWLSRLDPRKHELMRVLGALGVVVGLILLTRSTLRRAGGGGFVRAGRPSGVLEILARYPVGRGQQLVLIKMARRVLLVHQTGSTMSTLSEVCEGQEVAALLARIEAGTRGRTAQRFRSMLEQYGGEYEQPSTPVANGRVARRLEPDAGEVIDLTQGRFPSLHRVLGRARGGP